MKLELKHLAAYLPYGLMIHQDGGYPIEMETDHLRTSLFEDKGWYIGKPILRPFPDLIKEIEHNGEKFKPINRIPLPKSKPTYLQDLIKLSNGEKDFKTFEYQTIELLLKWHFDVFGLIDKDLAIEK